VVKSVAHRSDFLLLRHDNFLRHAPELLVVPVAQFSLRHVDCALVVRPIIATKSTSASPDGWICIALIILAMAALLSAMNAESSALATNVDRAVVAPIRNAAIIARLGWKSAWGRKRCTFVSW
jgi:hypothetical protein